MRIAILLAVLYTVGIIINAQIAVPLFILNVLAIACEQC